MKRFFVMVAVLAMILPSCEKNGEEQPTCNHSWIEGVCSACGEVCQHSWMDGQCTICDGKKDAYNEETNTYYAATVEGLRTWKDALFENCTANLVLIDDIVFEEGDKWSNAIYVEGHIEGYGYTIKNLTCDKGYFISRIRNGGSIRNLNFENVNISNTSSYAAIVGIVDSECMVTNCRVSGVLSSGWTYAGIVGCNHGYVSSCINEATVYCKDTIAGGIVGCNLDGTVVACMNLSTSVSGKGYIGSIVGQNYANVYGCLGVVSTSGEGTIKASECVGEDINKGKTTGCVIVNSMSEVTAEHIATMNETIAALGYSYRWVEGKDGGAPRLTSAE